MDNMTQARNKMNRRIGTKISRMTSEEAREMIAALEPKTIEQPLIRELTGGFASQAINGLVRRKLGVKAGYIKNF
jgi:hypothetical protein